MIEDMLITLHIFFSNLRVIIPILVLVMCAVSYVRKNGVDGIQSEGRGRSFAGEQIQ